ncbi:stalk domain-containing protein [Paenibacillus donghaensis]|uniref:stalk domain-containing protein n=1 Tax=Paenibacillus donghaensis TaxID=414771 RepID=UPI0012F9F9BD|nr:stalk domain-containing protein [Paenibacillus donghaensis]
MKKAIIGLVAGMLIGSAGMAAAATTQTVQAVFAKFTLSVDGQKQTLKNDPLVYRGTTYLPVREVAEMTGYGLEYDNTKKSIDLKTKGDEVSVGITDEINLNEFISTKVLVADYDVDVSAESGKIRDVTYKKNDNIIVYSMPGTLVDGIYNSVDGLHKAAVKDGAIYLSKEAVSFLGISI